jgi:hypothetical protein
MAARLADGYFYLVREAAARKRVQLATVTNDMLLQVIPILLMKYWSKILDTLLLNHCICKIFECLLMCDW